MLSLALTDDHFHRLLAYLPILCFGSAIVPLTLGLLWRSRRILVGGLVAIGIVAVSAPLVLHTFEGDEHHEAAPRQDDEIEGAGQASELAERLHEREEAAEATAIRDAMLIAVGLALSSALVDDTAGSPPPSATLDKAAGD